MALATASAAAAATWAGFTYLDGRYHLRQDLATFRGRRKNRQVIEQLVKEKRCSLYYLFEKRVKADPNVECIWSRQGCYTRAEAYVRVNKYAQWYMTQGVKPGDLVALFMINSPDMVFAWAALWAVGAAPALINHNLGKQALLHCIALSNSRLILVDGSEDLLQRAEDVRAELTEKGVNLVRLQDVMGTIGQMSPERLPDKVREDVMPSWPFGLFYTSGTTGMPKAVSLPVGAGISGGIGREIGTAIVDQEGERYYDCMPLYHGTGGISGMTQILTGTTLCLAPKFSASKFWQDIRDSKATWFVYVGETLRYLLSAPASPLDKQHNVHSIYGNGLRPDVWARFRDRFGITRIHEFYNSTEGALALDNPCKNDFRAHSVGHHGLLMRRHYKDLIIPVEVDTDTGDIVRDPKTGFARRVPYEEGGEVLIAHPGERPFPGYFRDEKATSKKFEKDVFKKGDMWFRTGDALRRDSHGRWYFKDRLGDSFRWKGENVSTSEVSEVLGKYPGVDDAAVYGVSLPGHDGKAGMAAIYINPAKKANFNLNEFLAHARTHLPKYAVPVFVRITKQPSITHNNKQNKVPLKKSGIDPDKVEGDPLYWVPGFGQKDTYEPYGKKEWDELNAEKAKL